MERFPHAHGLAGSTQYLKYQPEQFDSKRRSRGYKLERKKSKYHFFADDMTVYKSDPKNFTRELLNLINNFSEVVGYKTNSNKSVAFLYTKDKQDEKEIRETTPFTIITNNIKQLVVTITKKVKYLYDKNFKSLKKEI